MRWKTYFKSHSTMVKNSSELKYTKKSTLKEPFFIVGMKGTSDVEK